MRNNESTLPDGICRSSLRSPEIQQSDWNKVKRFCIPKNMEVCWESVKLMLITVNKMVVYK